MKRRERRGSHRHRDALPLLLGAQLHRPIDTVIITRIISRSADSFIGGVHREDILVADSFIGGVWGTCSPGSAPPSGSRGSRCPCAPPRGPPAPSPPGEGCVPAPGRTRTALPAQKKRHLFNSRSFPYVCPERACLGKMVILFSRHYRMAPKRCFFVPAW